MSTTTYPEDTLILAHLRDPRSGAMALMPGVIVIPDEHEPTIRVRDDKGEIRDFAVSIEQLSER